MVSRVGGGGEGEACAGGGQRLEQERHAGERLRRGEKLELKRGLLGGVFLEREGEVGPGVEDAPGLELGMQVSCVVVVWGGGPAGA